MHTRSRRRGQGRQGGGQIGCWPARLARWGGRYQPVFLVQQRHWCRTHTKSLYMHLERIPVFVGTAGYRGGRRGLRGSEGRRDPVKYALRRAALLVLLVARYPWRVLQLLTQRKAGVGTTCTPPMRACCARRCTQALPQACRHMLCMGGADWTP